MDIFNPSEIEKKSFAIIESEVPKPLPFQGNQWKIVRRMIHASADFDLLNLVRFHPDAIESGVNALRKGCFIITDTKMIVAGINKYKLKKLGCKIRCFISHNKVKKIASEKGLTRAWVAVDFAIPYINNSIYVVGNSPTALVRLLDLVSNNTVFPSLIIGMPVGFVNVIESKEKLIMQKKVPYITVKGRKGGSHLAVAVINQLLEVAIS